MQMMGRCATFTIWMCWSIVVICITAMGRADDLVTTTKPVVAPLPEAFAKEIPESIEDLRAIESHLTQLLPRLQLATVAVRIREARGSGVLVTSQGLIMTAGHVSGRPGREVEVTLSDGTQVFGRTLGRNRNLDTGLIQLDGTKSDWPFCPMVANPEDRPATQLGEWCIALGHPGGHQHGRSAPVRFGRVLQRTNRLLQTDCELVGGDSGGPLFNMQGEVIGINSRIGEDLDFNFHVPQRVFQYEWKELLASRDLDGTEDLDGDQSREALLGVSGQADPAGLKVIKVFENEPAARAGIQVGDLMITFDGQRITSMQQLVTLVGTKLPGDEVTIELIRHGERMEIVVELDLKWKP